MRVPRKEMRLLDRYIKRFKEPEEPPPPNPIYRWTEEDQEYLDQITKRNLRLKIEAHRSDPEPRCDSDAEYLVPGLYYLNEEIEEGLVKLEEKAGLRESRIEPIKNCRKCYFATSTRVLNTVWYCFCTNRPPARFVVARSNLPCWRDKR